MTYIKICGITNVEDAYCAAEAGADLIGFILTPKSARYVTVQEAAYMAGAVRDAFGAGAPRTVGVFVDEPVERVREIVQAARLDLAQLHGDESPDHVRALSPFAYKAIRPQDLGQAQIARAAYQDTVPGDDAIPELLVDAYHPREHGGTGLRADVGTACYLARHVRLILAGGLTPETVAQAIEQVRPWGVDVSSGVERIKRIKDHARVRAFVDVVRSAHRETAGGIEREYFEQDR